MRIAVASDDGITLSMHFGRAKGFVIAEVENKEVKSINFIPNSEPCGGQGNCEHHGEHHSRGSHHQKILEILEGVEVVISGGMGAHIYDELKAAGKQVYVTDETDVMESIKLFLEGRLPHIEELLH